MRAAFSLVVVAMLATPLSARPLVTSSEEPVGRVCLARVDLPARIVTACDAALSEAGLSQNQRAEMLVARGDGHLWQDQHAEAVASYRAALEINAASVDAWNGLGWALWESDGDRAALDAFENSLAIEASVQGLGGKAATARRLGLIDGEGARAMLEAALTIDPDYIWAVREIAWSFFEDDRFTDAEHNFSAALEIDPDDVNARFGLARSYLSQDRQEEALTLFNAVLADAPEDFPALVYRVIALRGLDRNAQALREADRVIASFPDRASGYIEKGQALLALERRVEAIKNYEQADKELGPNNAILYWYADALTIDGQYRAALSVINRGLELEGVDYSDHLLRSYIALELEDFGLARVAAEASLATGVEDPWAHYYLAIIHVNEGDADTALSSFEKAMAAGLPKERVSAFARELINAGKYVEAAQLRLQY